MTNLLFSPRLVLETLVLGNDRGAAERGHTWWRREGDLIDLEGF